MTAKGFADGKIAVAIEAGKTVEAGLELAPKGGTEQAAASGR